MQKILLDSDVIISFLRNKDFGIEVIKKVKDFEEIYISVATWAEIMVGVRKSKSPGKSKESFYRFLFDLYVTTLPIDIDIAELYSKWRVSLEKKGERLHDFDLLIAATAIGNGLTLATGNKKHFSRITDLKLYI